MRSVMQSQPENQITSNFLKVGMDELQPNTLHAKQLTVKATIGAEVREEATLGCKDHKAEHASLSLSGVILRVSSHLICWFGSL